MPELRVSTDGAVLDFGCAEQPYRRFFAPDVEFVGADLPGNPHAQVEIAADGTLALDDGRFDALLSTQVLEHVSDPAVYLGECRRLLRARGRMLLSTHGLMPLHPDPVDYWRWTSDGLRHAVETAGFEILRFEGVMGMAATGLQLTFESYYQRLRWRRGQQLMALLAQALIGLADRSEGREARRLNACVFALVAEKR